jgi:hypothetical protein
VVTFDRPQRAFKPSGSAGLTAIPGAEPLKILQIDRVDSSNALPARSKPRM